MNKKALSSLMAASLVLLGTAAVRAQSFFQTVTNLQPVGYWPMHEVEAAAQGDIETNYGSLGALANGYYNDWSPNWTNGGTGLQAIIRQVAGPVVSPGSAGSYGTYFTNSVERVATSPYLLVPNVSPALTLTPPFTVEGWAEASVHNNTLSSMVSQGGGAGLNNNANYGGFSLNWNTITFGTSGTIFNMYAFDGSGSGTSTGAAGAPSTLAQSNTWYYFAYMFTSNNTSYCVANGAVNGPSGQLSPPLAPASWSPLYLANGRAGNTGPAGFSFDGALAEVAIYTNQLSVSDFAAHYNAGTNASPTTNYFTLITNDNPIIYLRMNAPAYTAPPVSTWPTLTNCGSVANYGSLATNGVYTPGTVPDLVTGLVSQGFPVNVTNYMPLFSSMGTFADAGSNSMYNPTGSSATFSVCALFRGNPADPRVQSIVGHGTNSWQLGLTTSGRVVFNPGTNSATATATGTAGGDVVGTATNDDGYWHYVVATDNEGTNVLYVDGLPVATNVSTASIPGNAQDVMIAADPSYTNANDNLGRQFSGQVCEVAFFTNALTAANVQTLYNALGVGCFIIQQPSSASVNAGTAFTNKVVASGSTPFYQWYYNSSSSNYTGAIALTNTPDGRIVCSNRSSLVITNVHSSDAGWYYVAVTNTFLSVTSSLVSLTVYSSPAFISQLPVPYTNLTTIFAGASPAFSVAAGGAQPISYYWFSNNVAVAGGTTSTNFTQTNLQVGLITNYCVASNFVGSVTSFVWGISVVSAPTALYPAGVLALHPSGYWRLNDTNLDGVDNMGGDDGYVCNDYINGNNGIYTNTLLGQPGYNSVADPTTTSAEFAYYYTHDCDANSIQGVDFSVPTGTNAEFSVAAWVQGVSSYAANAGIASKGYFNNEEFTLDTGSTTANAYRFEVRGTNGTAYNANSTVVMNDNTWHLLVGVCDEASGALTLYIDGLPAGTAAIPAKVGIWTNNAAVPMIIGARPTSATSGADNQFGGYVNDVAIFKYALTGPQVFSLYTNSGVRPFFDPQPPATAIASEGGTLTIAGAADYGTLPITNQWWDSSVNNSIAGQTSATLVINPVSSSLNGHLLYLQAANAYGTTNSSTVAVTIYSGSPTIISNLPPSLSLVTNQTYIYSIGAAGTLPLSYQWYSNGVPVVGQTGSSYEVTAIAGPVSYSVVVTNIDGAVTNVSVLTGESLPTYYFASVLGSLGPVGYWPLQETNAAAPATMETNYGLLGRLGDGYYVTTNGSSPTLFDQGGALAGDSDLAAEFKGNGTANTPTGYLLVPRVTPALTIQAPYSMEVWVNCLSSAPFGDVISEGGSGFDSPPGGGNFAGVRMAWGGGANPLVEPYVYTGSGSTLAVTGNPLGTAGAWNHCVFTWDGSTFIVYVNGLPAASAGVSMATNAWAPLTIGAGYWEGVPVRGMAGDVDEVAIYTNVLSQQDITNHYLAGISSTSNYVQTVMNDNPLLYYRMDCTGYTNQAPAFCPIALDFGSATINGYYPSGTRPGLVSGPTGPGLGGTNLVAAAMNGAFSCVDAGYVPAFNPTGTQPFTAMTWFKTYPSDGRIQAIMSHGQNWSLYLVGTNGTVAWTTIGNVVSTNVLNDGNWHFVAGVYDGSHSYLYVDGTLNNSANTSGSLTGDATNDLCLGGNAAYTVVGSNEVYFAGALAQAAFYTNALTASQVKAIYQAAVSPMISINNLVITYDGTLLSSTNVVGPYLPVPGANSPYTIPATGAQMFYRTSYP